MANELTENELQWILFTLTTHAAGRQLTAHERGLNTRAIAKLAKRLRRLEWQAAHAPLRPGEIRLP